MFVVCGEALFDLFHANEPERLRFDARIGGSPLNVAVGLARLGQPVAFLGGISNDFLGERLVKALQAEGVDIRTAQRSAARTTLSVVGVDAAGVPAYAFYGEGAADRQLTHDVMATLPLEARVLQLGSFSLVVEPVAGVLRALVDAEWRRRLVAYDPNVRLNVEPSLQRWREALQWMLPRTALLKISAEDLELLYPGVDAAGIAARWLDTGVSLVVVTHGAEGAQAFTAQAQAHVPGRAVMVIDTVGAGDSFQSALLCWLAERGNCSTEALRAMSGSALGDALSFAAQAAAVTCSRLGADPPRRSELG